MGPLPKPQYDYPLLPLPEEEEGFDREPCESALAEIDEQLREELEGQEFEPASPSW